MAEVILPGTYIKVYDEGLISAGAVASGNIGIVGTANKGPTNEVQIVSSFSEARSIFGEAGNWDAKSNDNLSLIRSLELIFNNGGSTVYAVRIATSSASVAKLDLKKGAEKFLSLQSKSSGTYGNDISVEIAAIDGEKRFIATDGQLVEKYTISTVKQLALEIDERSQLLKTTFSKEIAFLSPRN